MCSVVLLVPAYVCGQTVKQNAGEKPIPSPTATPLPDPNFLQWRSYLNTLAQSAKSVSEERRPYVFADIAAAYLEYDRDEAISVITSAYDEALKLKQQDDKKYQPVLKYVLTVGSRFGTDVVLLLAERGKKAGDDKTKNDKSSSADVNDAITESIAQDARRAADLAKALAPNGLKENTSAMRMIFDFARQDQALGDEVFAAYLEKASADDTIPLGSLLQLGGYAFGYNESYYISETGNSSTSGDQFMKANPAFATAFLSLAYRRIKTMLDNSGDGTMLAPWEANTVLFTTGYLMLDVPTFAPESSTAWEMLQQRAITGRTPEQVRIAADRVNNVRRYRPQNGESTTETPNSDAEIEAILADIDKKGSGCERDLAYTRAVQRLIMSRDLKRAEEMLDKITDSTKVEKLRDILISRRIGDELQRGDFENALKDARKMPTMKERAFELVRVSGSMIRAKQTVDGGKAADEAVKALEKLDQPKERAAGYFQLATMTIRDQPSDAFELLDKAIKNLNKFDPADTGEVNTGSMTIDMGCPAGKTGSTWSTSLGSNGTSVYSTVASFIKQDFIATGSAVDAISDKATKLRSQAMVAKAALAKYKPGSTGKGQKP